MKSPFEPSRSLILPFSPESNWELKRREMVICLGPHWPLQQPPKNYKVFTDPSQCDGDLYIYFASIGDTSSISFRCDKCKLNISGKTHENRIKVWEVINLKLALARMMLVCARGNTTFPISLPCISYIDSANSLAADIPLLDTGFSTQDGKIIYIAPFLPHRIANWDLEKGEWVPQAAFLNLTESSVLIITELLNNRRSLEFADKRVIGH